MVDVSSGAWCLSRPALVSHCNRLWNQKCDFWLWVGEIPWWGCSSCRVSVEVLGIWAARPQEQMRAAWNSSQSPYQFPFTLGWGSGGCWCHGGEGADLEKAGMPRLSSTWGGATQRRGRC